MLGITAKAPTPVSSWAEKGGSLGLSDFQPGQENSLGSRERLWGVIEDDLVTLSGLL